MRDRSDLGPGIALGVLCGVLLGYAGSSSDLAAVTSEGILGALVGAIVAGVISVATQLVIIREDRVRRAELEKSTQRANVLSVFVAVLTYSDYIQKLHNYYRTAMPNDESVVQTDFGTFFFKKPLRGPRRGLQTSNEQKAALMELRRAQFVNELMEMESMAAIVDFLEASYVRAIDNFDPKGRESGRVTMQGRKVTTVAKGEPLELREISDLLEQLRTALAEAAPEAKRALQSCIEITGELGLKVEVEVLEDSPGAKSFHSEF